MVRCRPGIHTMGPGSAERREERRTASGTCVERLATRPSPPYLAQITGLHRKRLAIAVRYGIPRAPLPIATRDRPQLA